MCTLSYFSHVQLFATSWPVAHKAPLSMGFSRQENWSGLLCPPPRDLPKPGIKPMSPAAPALQEESPGDAQSLICSMSIPKSSQRSPQLEFTPSIQCSLIVPRHSLSLISSLNMSG